MEENIYRWQDQDGLHERPMTSEEIIQSNISPRVFEIEQLLMNFHIEEFAEIDLQRKHHYDGAITLEEWDIFRLRKIQLLSEYKILKLELNELNGLA